MIKTIAISKRNEYKPGQIVILWNGMPDRQAKEKYKIIKLLYYNKADMIGEFRVKPINIDKDPGNLKDRNGHPSPGLR